MGLEQIGVELVAKNYEQFNKAIEGANKSTGGFNETLQGLSKVGGGIVAGALAIGAAAVAGFTAYLVDSVKAAGESEEIQAKLAAVIKSTGGAAGVTADQVNALAQAAMKSTKFDDDMVVSGENLLLTFTNIGKNVFPDATTTMLDMSEALGQDMKSSAIQLGKALNDPVKGITALSRVGVSFTDDQKKMIEQMVKAGDIEGAQNIILAEMNREFGGAAEAAGNTLPGKLTILKNEFDDIGKGIGAKLIPYLTTFVGILSDKLASPEVQSAIQSITDGITKVFDAFQEGYNFAGDWVDGLINIFYAFNLDPIAETIEDLQVVFDNVIKAFQNDKGLWVAVLAAMGAAVAAFAVTTAISMAPVIAGMLPVIAIMALVGAAAYYLYTAWTQDWFGIQEEAAAVWAFLQPIFASIVTWFQTNIPVAIAAVSSWWTGTLIPAMQMVGAWIQSNLVPIFNTVVAWLQVNIPIAIAAVSAWWTGTLIPAMVAVGNWITTVLVPTFQNIWNWLSTNIPAAIATVVNFWNTSFLPAITAVWAFISTYIIPLFTALAALVAGAVKLAFDVIVGVWQNFVMPALTALWGFINANLMPIFRVVAAFLQAELLGAFTIVSGFITATFNVAVDFLTKKFNDAMVIARVVEHFFGTILLGAFNGLQIGITKVIDVIQTMADKLRDIDKNLPSWLRPGSPTPFEIGLIGIGAAMKELTQTDLPKFTAGLSMTIEPAYATSKAAQYRAMLGSGTTTTTDARSYNLDMNTNLSTDSVSQGFEYFKMLGA